MGRSLSNHISEVCCSASVSKPVDWLLPAAVACGGGSAGGGVLRGRVIAATGQDERLFERFPFLCRLSKIHKYIQLRYSAYVHTIVHTLPYKNAC